MKLRKGDFVLVAKGKDAGKKGRVLRVYPEANRALVEGINFVKRHLRPGRVERQGGIVQKEMPVAIPNLRYFCLKCNQATRVGFKFLGDSKVRCCRKCGEIIETKSTTA
ncbi:MAG TPA: 50S ribosomal protein L24 [bacterium]|uniref:Large ribosomal subunit protein uL24 n=1 Tax=candidate division TA06 bacterium ADurb.Bin417 TaxID=1852828 RepID=A0A1V5MHN2_UNCT6|nr:MAG: 50S ribosomal protein L24 [candidate division TA06 bacterium ADurb.Bin417]HNQ35342.1 50S ribosomal protein L24 [bacterium]HNS49287.1 50S ribosomal protein L24 [bacterium]